MMGNQQGKLFMRYYSIGRHARYDSLPDLGLYLYLRANQALFRC